MMNLKWIKNVLKVFNESKTSVLIIFFLFYATITFNEEIKVALSTINYSRFSKEDIIKSSISNDMLINQSLQELLDDTESDRSYVFRFHNGLNYYTGTHKGRFSCDYEVVRKGITKEADNLQNLSTTLYSDFINEVLNYEMIHTDINNIKNERVKQTLRMQGINGIAVLPYYRNGYLLALIGVDYNGVIGNEEINVYLENKEELILRLKNKVKNIGDLLI